MAGIAAAAAGVGGLVRGIGWRAPRLRTARGRAPGGIVVVGRLRRFALCFVVGVGKLVVVVLRVVVVEHIRLLVLAGAPSGPGPRIGRRPFVARLGLQTIVARTRRALVVARRRALVAVVLGAVRLVRIRLASQCSCTAMALARAVGAGAARIERAPGIRLGRLRTHRRSAVRRSPAARAAVAGSPQIGRLQSKTRRPARILVAPAGGWRFARSRPLDAGRIGPRSPARNRPREPPPGARTRPRWRARCRRLAAAD